MENEQTQKYQNFISAQNFLEDPKIPESEFYTLKKYNEHTYHSAMECPPPPPPPPINYSYAEALLFVWLKGCSSQVEVNSRKTKENGISHLRENGPHSSDEGNPYIKTNLHTGCLRKIAKKGEHKSPPEHTFIWRLA